MGRDTYIPSTTEGKEWKVTVGKDRITGQVLGIAYEGERFEVGGVGMFRHVIGVHGDQRRYVGIDTKRLTTAARERAMKAVHDVLLADGDIKEAVL